MKAIRPSANGTFPRKAVKSVACRRRDLVIRISDWTKDRDEPAFDVETYIGGVYDYDESKVFPARNAGRTNEEAKKLAIAFARKQISKLL